MTESFDKNSMKVTPKKSFLINSALSKKYFWKPFLIIGINNGIHSEKLIAQSAGAVKYTDCTSAEG